MSKRLPWFRMYADFLNDPKMIGLAFEDQRHFIGVLALKSDGAIDDVADGDLLDRIVAQRLWIDHAIIRDVKRRLVAAGLIDANWQPLAWDKRQFVSDRDGTATERKRRERAAKAAAKSLDKSTQNDDVTDVSRMTSRNGHGNVTRLDTDTDTDKDKEVSPDGDTYGASAPRTSGSGSADGVGAGNPDAAPAAPPKTKRVPRLPDDWRLPKGWGDWALENRPDMTDADVRHQAACFADYWHGKAGADARKADWEATWRNWIRRADSPLPKGWPARPGRMNPPAHPQQPKEPRDVVTSI